jgi:hypothetical protein
LIDNDIKVEETTDPTFDPIEDQAVTLYPKYVDFILARPKEKAGELESWLETQGVVYTLSVKARMEEIALSRLASVSTKH